MAENKLNCVEKECPYIMQTCPQCGEAYLNPSGAELYSEIQDLRAENAELLRTVDKLNEKLIAKES